MLTVLCWLLLFPLLRVRATEGKKKLPPFFFDSKAGKLVLKSAAAAAAEESKMGWRSRAEFSHTNPKKSFFLVLDT